jgi:hypothetical protein
MLVIGANEAMQGSFMLTDRRECKPLHSNWIYHIVNALQRLYLRAA